MIKKVILITICCGMLVNLYSQFDTIPRHYELKGEVYRVADSLHRYWMTNKYPKILEKNGIVMSCAKCSNVYIDVTMNIDNDGKWWGVNVLKSNCCGSSVSDKLKLDLIYFFATYTFPPILRNRSFIYRLGTGLSC